jgi:chitinase
MADDKNPTETIAQGQAQANVADHFGLVEASGLQWRHLSSRHGDLPVPGESTQQTGCVVADLDHDGVNDFVLSFRQKAPALVWYRRTKSGWDRYVIDKDYLTVEAGGAVLDIDGDGYPDLVFGADWQGGDVWWWRNPGGHYDPNVPWERHTIKRGGPHQHHDQVFGDFKATGKPQLAFWNQQAQQVLLADIPPEPRKAQTWPTSVLFSGKAETKGGLYAEGVAAADIDGDGTLDLLAGNYWFKHVEGNTFKPIKFGNFGGRIAVGQLILNSKHPQIVINSGDGIGPLTWYECQGNPEDPAAWIGHELVPRVIHGHSLQIADIDGDGNLDIFAAEMAKWTESRKDPDNPEAKAWIFFGDGQGHFRQTVFSTGIGFHEARVADLNGDGHMDILDKPYNWDAPRVDVWLQEPAGQGSSAARAAAPENRLNGPAKVFVGYVYQQPRKMEFSLYTHLCHAFITPREDGDVRSSQSCPSRQLVADAHQAGVKVVVSVGGWGWDKQFTALVAKQESLDRFVASVMKIIDDYDYDGIDLDWEYPDTKAKAAGFDSLCRRLRSELDSLERKKGRRLIQTMAASAHAPTLEPVSNETLLANFDWINVMTYDYTGEWSSQAGHHSPLFASSKQKGSPHSTELTMKALLARGLPAERLAVGLPLYGRAFAVGEPYAALKRPVPKPTIRGGGYRNVAALVNDKGWTRRWDDETKNPWAIAPDGSAVIGYDDAESIAAKTGWAMSHDFRGVFFWQIRDDEMPDGSFPLQEAGHKKWAQGGQ